MLQKALKKARPGSTLLLEPGLYQGPILVRFSIRLVGEGDGVIIDSSSSGPTLLVDAPAGNRVVISNMTLLHQKVGEGPAHEADIAVAVLSGSFTAEGCTFTSHASDSVVVEGGASKACLIDCKMEGGERSGLLVFTGADVFGSGLTVKGNLRAGARALQAGSK